MPRFMLFNYWRSSASHRVRIALALKGLSYEYVSVNIVIGEQSQGPHAARSPTGYVPCLTIDGVRYTESVAIVELLEERFPAPALYPKDAHGRARVRTLVEIVNSGIQPLQNTSVLAYLPEGAETRAKWLGHFVARGLASLERAMGMNEAEGGHGASGPFAYGDSPTAADVFLVPQVAAAKRFGIDVAPFRRVSAAFDAARGLEAFRCAAPENQPDAVASSTG